MKEERYLENFRGVTSCKVKRREVGGMEGLDFTDKFFLARDALACTDVIGREREKRGNGNAIDIGSGIT